MNNDSRTYKSLKNSVIALSFYAVGFFLSFVSRRVFLENLGADIMGLNTTASSLLSFFNLAELGIGMAVAVTLYKPLLSKDYKAMGEIVSLQGWFYRRVAIFVLIGSAVIMCFFSRFFAKTGLPLWYAYASYSVLLFSSLLGYFINYDSIVLSANQQQYKVQYISGTLNIVKVVLQILAVAFLSFKYQSWLILEVLSTVIGAILVKRQVKNSFPQMITDVSKGSELNREYPVILQKVKQVFVHKIGGFALNHTSPLIIYAFSSLSLVTLYTNYLAITNGFITVLAAAFTSVNAGVGNLVAEGDVNRNFRVFREMFSSRFLIIGSSSICIYYLASAFIGIWLGYEYVLNQRIVLLIVLLFFIRTSREVVDSFTYAYGIFHDIWAPVVETFLNITGSILLGYLFGLEGILCGVLISQIVIILLWKPYLLFHSGFKMAISNYVLLYVKHIAILITSLLLSSAVVAILPISFINDYLSFCIYGFSLLLLNVLVMGSLLFVLEQGMRDFVTRIKLIFKALLKK